MNSANFEFVSREQLLGQENEHLKRELILAHQLIGSLQDKLNLASSFIQMFIQRSTDE